jgi:hypothetical protein
MKSAFVPDNAVAANGSADNSLMGDENRNYIKMMCTK